MSDVSVNLLSSMKTQRDLVGLAHGARCWRVGRQESSHTDENVAPRFGAPPGNILLESGIHYLEGVEPSILPQHGMAKGRQQPSGIGVRRKPMIQGDGTVLLGQVGQDVGHAG